jgi:hypothetical protein
VLAAREKEEAEARADAERKGFDAERQRNEAESARVSESQRNAMEVVGSALGRLAQGDLPYESTISVRNSGRCATISTAQSNRSPTR